MMLMKKRRAWSRSLSLVAMMAASCQSTEWRQTQYAITTEPLGCDVEVDGEPVGVTPCRFALAYTVRQEGGRGTIPNGESYTIACYPPDGSNHPKSRVVQPHEAASGEVEIHFSFVPGQ